MRFIILFASFYLSGYAQISGRILSEGSPDIILQTTVLQTGDKTEADFDGYFSVQIPDKPHRYDVLIEAGLMNFKITNITQAMSTIKMDSIELPALKNISVVEYNELNELEKMKYIPIFHWTNLVGYFDKFTLSKNYISFYCNGKEYQTNKFIFDPEERLISIDALNLLSCDQ